LKLLDSYLGCFQSLKLIRGLDALSISPFLVLEQERKNIYELKRLLMLEKDKNKELA
jgi:hypothetical protein